MADLATGLEKVVTEWGTPAVSGIFVDLYKKSTQQNLELMGKAAGYVAQGGSWEFTGNTSVVLLGPALSIPFKFYEIALQASPGTTELSYAHVSYPDAEGYSADQQRANYYIDAPLVGFDCGGNTYQTVIAGQTLAVGDVVQNTNTGSGANIATVTKVGSGDQVTAGIIVANAKGGNTIASGERGYALTAGLYTSSTITAANGTDINYTTGAVLTDGAGQGFAVGRVFQSKGTNAVAVISLNFKGGFRSSI